jgi:hypothetical protein
VFRNGKRVWLGVLLAAGLIGSMMTLLVTGAVDPWTGSTVPPREQAEREGRATAQRQAIAEGSRARVPRFERPADPSRERHFHAIRVKDEARLKRGRVPPSSELFEAEARDQAWAPAMEARLNERLRDAEAILAGAGLDDVKIAPSECRTSTCLLSFEYTSRNGLGAVPPLGVLVKDSGPFAASASNRGPQPLRVVDGVTHFRQTVHLVFGEEDSDPAYYPSWVATSHRAITESRRSKQR